MRGPRNRTSRWVVAGGQGGGWGRLSRAAFGGGQGDGEGDTTEENRHHHNQPDQPGVAPPGSPSGRRARRNLWRHPDRHRSCRTGGGRTRRGRGSAGGWWRRGRCRGRCRRIGTGPDRNGRRRRRSRNGRRRRRSQNGCRRRRWRGRWRRRRRCRRWHRPGRSTGPRLERGGRRLATDPAVGRIGGEGVSIGTPPEKRPSALSAEAGSHVDGL